LIIEKFLFSDKVEEIRELAKPHWEEVASMKGKRNLDIDEDFFLKTEQNGQLLCLGLFIEGKLIGYSVNILARDTHDKSKLICNNDALFILKEHRNGRGGVLVIKETEKEAKALGAFAVIWHAKPNSPLDKLLERMEYGIKDFLYMKEI
jgi:hypothetical protein